MVIGAVIGFVVGALVYRNNTSLFEPYAEKIDNLADLVNELKDKLEKQNKR